MLVVVAIVGFLVVVLADQRAGRQPHRREPARRSGAPAVVGSTLEGDAFDLADHAGQWVLVNFFATWCAPCRQEHDDLVDFHQRHPDRRRRRGQRGVQRRHRRCPPSLRGERRPFPVIVSDEGDIALDYGVAKVPESYLVVPDGAIVAKIIGGVTAEGLDELLARFA